MAGAGEEGRPASEVTGVHVPASFQLPAGPCNDECKGEDAVGDVDLPEDEAMKALVGVPVCFCRCPFCPLRQLE
jgi:hypothetical protein